jgi:hypothetical protein
MQFETKVTDDISLICGTPVMAMDVPNAAAINQAVLGEIRGAMAVAPGVRGSNVGGWQSAHEFWTWSGVGAVGVRAVLQRAMNTICALGTDQPDPVGIDIHYTAKAWVNVNGPGHYNVRHSNAQYDWQLFYFVAARDLTALPPPTGRLEIHDPRRLADISPLRRFGFAGSMLIEPTPGKLILIPAWMEHTIHPVPQPGELIWVSALAKMTGGRHSGLRQAG